MIGDPALATMMRPYVRKETWLARYPRKHKFAVAGALLILLALPFFAIDHGNAPAQASVHQSVHKKTREASLTASTQPSENVAPSPADSQTSDPAAIALNDVDDRSARMAPAPDPGLVEESSEGMLPKMGEDGRKPWQVYSRPFNTNDKRPRIALVMADMGLSRVASDAALRRLPASVTMAFEAESPALGAWLNRARQDGHETLLSLPMEPLDYPKSDPGPNTLLTNLPNSSVIQRINWALRQGVGYVGVTSLTGSRFTSDPDKLSLLFDVLKQRGLMVLDARVSPHSVVTSLAQESKIPVAKNVLRIDSNPSPAEIDAALTQLEQTARLTGRAVGIATPLPLTLDLLEPWIRKLPNNGIALAPITAVVE